MTGPDELMKSEPLVWATRCGHPEVAELLQRHGVR